MTKKLNAEQLAALSEDIVVTQDAIAPKKIKPTDHAQYNKVNELTEYDAMLDNVTYGPHSKTTINYLGVDWSFRLLSTEEEIQIKYEVDAICGQDLKNGVSPNSFRYELEEATRTVHLALSPNPFHTEDNPGQTKVYSLSQIRKIHKDVLLNLLRQYQVFVAKATQNPEELNIEQIEGYIATAKKHPEALMEFDYFTSLAVKRYLIAYSLELEKKINSAINSSAS